MPGVFLCHSSKDKAFVRRMAYALQENGVRVWLDESEIVVGDSLLERIAGAIEEMQYLAVILSPDSVASNWVKQELEIAINEQIQGNRVKVLPILYRDCHIPSFLKAKKYVDFREPEMFDASLSEFLKRFQIKRTTGPQLFIPLATGRFAEGAPALQAQGLGIAFRNHFVFEKVNFSIKTGEIFGIVGLPGTGKSVLANTIAGNQRYSGSLRLHFGERNIEVSSLTPVSSFGISAIRLVPDLSPSFGKKYSRTRIRDFITNDIQHLDNADSVMENVLKTAGAWGCVEDRLTDKFRNHSEACQVTLMLARALVTNPDILVLDNPLRYSYPKRRIGFLQALFNLNAKGITIIITADDFLALAPWCDQIAVLEYHGIKQVGSPASLANNREIVEEIGLDWLTRGTSLRNE